MKELLWISILSIPLLIEIHDDRNGDYNKKVDVLWRAFYMLISSVVVWYFSKHSLIGCLLMSFGIFFLLFDYAIASILMHRKVISSDNWFGYMGKKGDIDNMGWWRRIGPNWRFAIKFSVFAVALTIYFK